MNTFNHPPKVISWAVCLNLLSLILGMVFLPFLMKSPLMELMLQKTSFGVQLFIATFVAFALFVIWINYKIYIGRNWARNLILLLLCFGLPGAIAKFPDYFLLVGKYWGVLFLVQTILQVLAVCLMFIGQGGAWFDQKNQVSKRSKNIIIIAAILVTLFSIYLGIYRQGPEVDKSVWVERLVPTFKMGMCKFLVDNPQTTALMKERNISELQCRTKIRISVDNCVTKYYAQLPEKMNRKNGAEWGKTLGGCVGEDFYDRYMNRS